MLAVLVGCGQTPGAGQSEALTVETAQTYLDCAPGAACDTPFPVKVVVVTMFERGEDEGDAPGEFQFWKERMDLDTRVPMPHTHHDVFVNEDKGVIGMVTGIGTMHSGPSTMAVGLDPRFDFSKAYWLVAGIAGIDPEDASIGSAIWSAYLVDGDLSHQIDAREKPEAWETGYFARHTKFPGDPNRPIVVEYIQKRLDIEGRVIATAPFQSQGSSHRNQISLADAVVKHVLKISNRR